jgi:hypothetical protein
MRLACPTCGVQLDAPQSDAGKTIACTACGAKMLVPQEAPAAPAAQPVPPSSQGDPAAARPPIPTDNTLGGLIPVRNTAALVAYYLGIFSIIPCLGIPMGVAALVFGIKGLKLARLHPEVKGKAHAWVGIICGGFFAFIYFAALVFGFIVCACGR